MFISPEEIVKNLNLKEGDIVADFGCGSGAYVFTSSKYVGDRGRVYAVDRFTDMVDKINREADKKSIINIDGIVANVEEKVYLDNNSCDVIILSNILSEVYSIDNLIKEVKRVLKTDGRILIVDWKNTEENVTLKRHSLIEEEKALAILAKYGFEVIKHFPAGNYHYAFSIKNS